MISMEVDPFHAVIARNTIEWAGLSDYIEVWVGHSENLIPRLKERLPERSIDILFFDQQGKSPRQVGVVAGPFAIDDRMA